MEKPHKKVNSLDYLRGDKKIKKLSKEEAFKQKEESS